MQLLKKCSLTFKLNILEVLDVRNTNIAVIIHTMYSRGFYLKLLVVPLTVELFVRYNGVLWQQSNC